MTKLSGLVWALCLLGCGNPPFGEQPSRPEQQATATVVTPPFLVRDGAKGLLFVWYDGEGAAHTETRISNIPPARREMVRVDSLELPPERRLDPQFVYVADLRSPGADGSYAVRKLGREAFAKAVIPAAADPGPALEATSSEVVIYGAAWCGACKQAAGYFRSKGVPFTERDIEKEPDARREMLAKAKKQGINPSGIPVIDVKGTLVGGFNPAMVESLLAAN